MATSYCAEYAQIVGCFAGEKANGMAEVSLSHRVRRAVVRGVAYVAGLLFASYVGCVIYAYLPYPERPREALLESGDRIAHVEGHALRYRSYPAKPAADRPTLILLHGFAGSLHAWDRVAPGLSAVANVVAVDLMPFGLSDKPLDFAYSYRSQARIIGGLVEVLGIRDPIPMGHSYGGTIAAYMAWLNPRVSRVVLVDPGIHSTGIPSFVRHMFFPMARVGARMFGAQNFRRRFLAKSFVDKRFLSAELVRGITQGTDMQGYLAGTSSFMSQYTDVEVQGLLQGIKAKALLVWGEHDRNNPVANAKIMAKHLPGATTAIIKHSGHYPQAERPREVVEAVSTFLQRSAASPPIPSEKASL